MRCLCSAYSCACEPLNKNLDALHAIQIKHKYWETDAVTETLVDRHKAKVFCNHFVYHHFIANFLPKRSMQINVDNIRLFMKF